MKKGIDIDRIFEFCDKATSERDRKALDRLKAYFEERCGDLLEVCSGAIGLSSGDYYFSVGDFGDIDAYGRITAKYAVDVLEWMDSQKEHDIDCMYRGVAAVECELIEDVEYVDPFEITPITRELLDDCCSYRQLKTKMPCRVYDTLRRSEKYSIRASLASKIVVRYVGIKSECLRMDEENEFFGDGKRALRDEVPEAFKSDKAKRLLQIAVDGGYITKEYKKSATATIPQLWCIADIIGDKLNMVRSRYVLFETLFGIAKNSLTKTKNRHRDEVLKIRGRGRIKKLYEKV